MNKIILITIITLTLSISTDAYAARLMPTDKPLQPIPEGVEVNISENINSENSEFNQILESQIPIVEVEQESGTITEEDEPNLVPENISAPPTRSYWFLLFFGLAGLIAAMAWAYWRFIRKL